MLIDCPECANKISDKAISCPHCGYPININTPNMADKPSKKALTRHKWHRLPSGFGSIRKMTGKRRNPYGAYPAIKDYHDNGTAKMPTAIGYYATYQEALQALTEYNKKPYDLKNDRLTFAEVFEMFYKDKFENSKREYSEQMKASNRSAFKNLSQIHSCIFKDLRTNDIQEQLDNCSLKHASLELMVMVVKGMYKFAIKNDLIDKDYGQFVKINIADDDEKGVPFTEEELFIMFKHTDNQIIRSLLVMAYSGMRISELNMAEIDFQNSTITTGVKTEAGKNRVIPIHNGIRELLSKDCKTISPKNVNQQIRKALEDIGIDPQKHTAHDCRHTFSWLADKYKMDNLSKHMIMGHSTKNLDIEQSTYGHRSLEELKTEMDKIRLPFA